MRFEGGGNHPLTRDLNLWYPFDKVCVFFGGGGEKNGRYIYIYIYPLYLPYITYIPFIPYIL